MSGTSPSTNRVPSRVNTPPQDVVMSDSSDAPTIGTIQQKRIVTVATVTAAAVAANQSQNKKDGTKNGANHTSRKRKQSAPASVEGASSGAYVSSTFVDPDEPEEDQTDEDYSDEPDSDEDSEYESEESTSASKTRQNQQHPTAPMVPTASLRSAIPTLEIHAAATVANMLPVTMKAIPHYEQEQKRQKTGKAQKKRYYNSCHICKCAFQEDVEHVRCKCGVMFCSRTRCCKRIGVDFTRYKALLVRGGECVHCCIVSLSDAGIKLNDCPNSNCQTKKRKGIEARKYNVSVIADEVILAHSDSSSDEKYEPPRGVVAAATLVTTRAHAHSEKVATAINAISDTMDTRVQAVPAFSPMTQAFSSAHAIAPSAATPVLTPPVAPVGSYVAYAHSQFSSMPLPSLPLAPGNTAMYPMLTLRPPMNGSQLGNFSMITGSGPTGAGSTGTSLHGTVAPTTGALTATTASLDLQIAQLEAQNAALLNQRQTIRMQTMYQQHIQNRAHLFGQPPSAYALPSSQGSLNTLSNASAVAAAGQFPPTPLSLLSNGAASLSAVDYPATSPMSKLPPAFHQFLSDSHEHMTKAMMAYVPIWTSQDVSHFCRHNLQLSLRICECVKSADLDGARFLNLVPSDMQQIFRLDSVHNSSEIEMLLTAVHALKKHYDNMKQLTEQQQHRRMAHKHQQYQQQQQPSAPDRSTSSASSADGNEDLVTKLEGRTMPNTVQGQENTQNHGMQHLPANAPITVHAENMPPTPVLPATLDDPTRKMIPYTYSYPEYHHQQQMAFPQKQDNTITLEPVAPAQLSSNLISYGPSDGTGSSMQHMTLRSPSHMMQQHAEIREIMNHSYAKASIFLPTGAPTPNGNHFIPSNASRLALMSPGTNPHHPIKRSFRSGAITDITAAIQTPRVFFQ